jgi:hypothetical protein
MAALGTMTLVEPGTAASLAVIGQNHVVPPAMIRVGERIWPSRRV